MREEHRGSDDGDPSVPDVHAVEATERPLDRVQPCRQHQRCAEERDGEDAGDLAGVLEPAEAGGPRDDPQPGDANEGGHEDARAETEAAAVPAARARRGDPPVPVPDVVRRRVAHEVCVLVTGGVWTGCTRTTGGIWTGCTRTAGGVATGRAIRGAGLTAGSRRSGAVATCTAAVDPGSRTGVTPREHRGGADDRPDPRGRRPHPARGAPPCPARRTTRCDRPVRD